MLRRVLLRAIPLTCVMFLAAAGCEGIVNDTLPSFRCDPQFDAGVCPTGQYCLGSTCVPNDTLALDAAVIDCGDHRCAPGQVCAPKTNQCIDASAACTVDSCHPPEECDFGTRQCLEPAAKKIGEGCTGDKECEAGAFCAYSPVLTTDVVKSFGLCTKPCCTSNDCPTDFACFGAGTGGNYCVSKGILQRPTLGPRPGGAACTVQADCRSGICDATNKCADTCCTASNCINDTVCRAVAVTGVGTATKYVLGCGAPEGDNAPGATCEVVLSGKCAQGACEEGTNKCSVSCCGSSACHCTNTKARGHTEMITACANTAGSSGTKKLGDACENAGECIGNQCLQDSPETAKYCSDVCCTDTDCAGAGLVCRPRDAGQGRFLLRCVRN